MKTPAPKPFSGLKFEMMQMLPEPHIRQEWMIGASWYFAGDDRRSCWNSFNSLAECFEWAANIETAIKLGTIEGNPDDPSKAKPKQEGKPMQDIEASIVVAAQNLVSDTNWKLGDMAAAWLDRYARGRTVAEFGAFLGLSHYRIEDCLAVHRRFRPVREKYPRLRFGHFYAALKWDDAEALLAWANDVDSTVAEMRAYRRATRGEDLSVEEEAEQL